MNIAEVILSNGDAAATAVVHKSMAVTYGELRSRVAKVADALAGKGQLEGDRVGILSENSPFFVAAYLGTIQAGMVAVPFQTDFAEESFSKIIRDAGIRVVLASGRMAGRAGKWAGHSGISLLVDGDAPLSVDHRVEGRNAPSPQVKRNTPEVLDSKLASIMFTSGSTGQPKGVMLTQRNIECNTRDIIAYMRLTSRDRAMVVLPFYYCFGLSLLHTHLMVGGSVVLNNDFALYPENVMREMLETECTGFAGVPSTYQILLRKTRFPKMSFPRLRWLQQAGGKLPNACIEELIHTFPSVQFYLMYGQSEATARLSFLPPDRLRDKLGSIGTGLPSTRLEVLRSDGRPVAPRARGESCGRGDGQERIGEIVAQGDNVSPGYWNDSEETAKYFRNGKLYTGDLAEVDEDGFIYIVERERDIIKSGGNRVSSKEIEDVLAEIPQVVEAAVVGAPHELLGEAIKAFVVMRRDAELSERDLQAHCRKRLPTFKNPEEIIFLSAMPHNSAGKILKPELKRMARERTELSGALKLSNPQ